MKNNIEEPEVVVDKQRLIRRQFAKWRQRRKPELYETLEKRLTEYFSFCEEIGITPAIESCALCVGVSRTTLFRWRQGKGCSPAWQQAIDRVYQTILASVETDGIAGKILPVTAIWLQKQYGYKDTLSLEEQANQGSRYEERAYKLPSDIIRELLPEPKETITDDLSRAEEHEKDVVSIWDWEENDDPTPWMKQYIKDYNA